MAVYGVRIMRNGSPVVGAEVIMIGERVRGVTGSDGIVSTDLGSVTQNIGVHLIIVESTGQIGIGPLKLQGGVTLDVGV